MNREYSILKEYTNSYELLYRKSYRDTKFLYRVTIKYHNPFIDRLCAADTPEQERAACAITLFICCTGSPGM